MSQTGFMVALKKSRQNIARKTLKHKNTPETAEGLKQIIQNMKVDNIIRQFARKIKSNVINTPPVVFTLESQKFKDQARIFPYQGFDIERKIQTSVLLLDILMNIIMLVIATFQGFLVDYRQSDAANTPLILVFKIVAQVIYLAQVIMTLINLQYKDGKLLKYISDIIINQFVNINFYIRIFAIVMLFISLFNRSNEVVGIILFFSILLKFVSLSQNLRSIQIFFINSQKKFYIFSLSKVVLFNFIFAHIIATTLLAASRIYPQENWIKIKLVAPGFLQQRQTWYQLYIWSYYWACTIMMTIGFGDITPIQYEQAFIVSFIEIFGCLMLAYNINEIGSLIGAIRSKGVVLQRKLGVLRRMAEINPIPPELREQIQNYLNYQTTISEQFQYAQHRQIIDSLPTQLKQQYFYHQNHNFYINLPLFRNLQRDTQAALNQAFQCRIYYPGQYIINHKNINQEVTIMKTGRIGLSYWKRKSDMNGTIVQELSIQLKQGQPVLLSTKVLNIGVKAPNYDIKALKYSYCLTMPVQRLQDILKEFPIDYCFYISTYYSHIKNKNMYSYATCEYCKQKHTKFECPRFHYTPCHSEIVWKHIEKGIDQNAVRKNKNRKKMFLENHVYFIRKNLFIQVEKDHSHGYQWEWQDHQLQIDQAYNLTGFQSSYNSQMLHRQALKQKKTEQDMYAVNKYIISLKKIQTQGNQESQRNFTDGNQKSKKKSSKKKFGLQ